MPEIIRFRASIFYCELYDVEEQAEKANITTAIIDGSSFTRKETKSYPGAALREVILNAFCHADYFLRSDIKIEFFPDRAKIVNPGGVFNATIEDVMNGVQTYRNPKLVHIFDKLGLIENFGTGIPRTLDAYKASELKPTFESSDKYFFVSLPNLNYRPVDQINDQINDQISDLALLILRVIKEQPGINVPLILEEIRPMMDNVSPDRIRNELRRNLTKYIEHRGSNKTGGYYIKDVPN
jgi:ATP-dependent DNA helicase RecG